KPFILLLLAIPHSFAAADCGNEAICVFDATSENSATVYAINRELFEATLHVNAALVNTRPSVSLPHTYSLPGRTKAAIVAFQAYAYPWQYKYSFHWVVGSMHANHDQSIVYDLPYRGTRGVAQGFHGTFSHMIGSDEYAVDWTMTVGTPVYAAREGMVVGMRDYMTQGG